MNNAGYGVFAPLEGVSMGAFREQLDVDVSAQLAVTQVFLPMLRRARGRIVMVGSVAARITMPFAGPQAASNRAMVALADALRLELSAWQLKVILIEPASIRTAAIGKLQRDTSAVVGGLDTRNRAAYGALLGRAVRRALHLERHGSDPDVVADRVARAVSARRPRARYLVGRHARRLAVMAALRRSCSTRCEGDCSDYQDRDRLGEVGPLLGMDATLAGRAARTEGDDDGPRRVSPAMTPPDVRHRRSSSRAPLEPGRRITDAA